MLKKSKLVLCIDRDNDLYEKAGISGPVIGREANLNAAMKLGLSDPAETDTNAIFRAIQIFDKLSKEYNVQLATLTGSSRLGYEADESLSSQLDRIVAEFPTESCIFVSDGASDASIMPIIRSRLKIDSVEIVVMKQAKELEKTYFVILEKLKEPYYARLIFGVPAIVLLALAISSYFQLGWQPIAIIVALYLVARAFGIEDWFARILSSFEFSVDRISAIAYLLAVPFIAISVWVSYQAYVIASESGLNPAKTFATTVRALLEILPWSLILLIAGRVVDLINEKRRIEVTKYGLYAIVLLLFSMVLSVGAKWVVNDVPPYVSFADFLLSVLAAGVMGYISMEVMRRIKQRAILSLKLDNKEVLGTSGNYVGKVIGVDARDGALAVRSALGQKYIIALESIERVGDKIIVGGQR